MSNLILGLLGAVSTGAPVLDSVPPSNNSIGAAYCQTNGDDRAEAEKPPAADDIKKCNGLAKLLKAAEVELGDRKRSANLANAECQVLVAQIKTPSKDPALTAFTNALNGAASASGGAVSIDAAFNCEEEVNAELPLKDGKPVTNSDDCPGTDANCKKLLAARDKFIPAAELAADYKAALVAKVKEFEKWQTDRRFSYGSDPAKRFSETDLAMLKKCDVSLVPDRVDHSSDYLSMSNSNVCAILGSKLARSNVALPADKYPTSLTGTTITPSLALASSSGNIGLTFARTNQITSKGFNHFDSKKRVVRDISTFTYSVGIEAEASDGSAGVFDGDNDLFGLDRLSSDALVKGSFGWNFYPSQTFADFDKARSKFLKKARAACQASLKVPGAQFVTTCADSELLPWLYESKDGEYVRAALLQEYNKLIWHPTAKYPEWGFGLNGSIGFPERSYQNFRDADGNFDPISVDVDLFFSDNSTTRSDYAETFKNKAAVTLGLQGYRHFSGKEMSAFEGVTLVGKLNYKRDLADDLDDDKTQVCRTDTAAAATVVSVSDICRTVLPFEPELQTTYVLENDLRIGTKSFWILPRMGFGLKTQYEIRRDDKNQLRLEFPLYFYSKDDKLTGGISLVRNVDYETPSKSAWNFLLNLGTEFSLDGSK